jgi:hypothetical protein
MKLTILLILLILTSSCAIKMSASDFESEARRYGSSTNLSEGLESSVLYKGSDEEFHYFYITPKVGFPRSVKVSKEEMSLADEFKYSDDELKWLEYDTVK